MPEVEPAGHCGPLTAEMAEMALTWKNYVASISKTTTATATITI